MPERKRMGRSARAERKGIMDEKKIIKMAILGAGNIAAKMADTVCQMEGVKLFAVASRNLEKAQKFAALHSVEKAYQCRPGQGSDFPGKRKGMLFDGSHVDEISALCKTGQNPFG